MNLKYAFLNDDAWLEDQLIVKQKSMSQLAKEIAKKSGFKKANLAASIRFRVMRWPEEKRKLIKQERPFHKNRKSK